MGPVPSIIMLKNCNFGPFWLRPKIKQLITNRIKLPKGIDLPIPISSFYLFLKVVILKKMREEPSLLWQKTKIILT